MSFSTVENLSLTDQVFDKLAAKIVLGELDAGELLPAERALAASFGVNRHVIREATKRLSQVGLVKIIQGGGTRVLDMELHGSLDLLALMAEAGRGVDDTLQFWLPVLEMRATIAADVARRCSQRAESGLRDEIFAVATRLKAIGSGPDLYPLDAKFWELVIQGSANLAYRLAYNTLMRAARAQPELGYKLVEAEMIHGDFHLPIARAILDGDSDRAAAEAEKSLGGVAEIIRASIPGLDPHLASRNGPLDVRSVGGAAGG